MNIQSDFVDQICGEQRSGQLPASHQADLPALLTLQLSHERDRVG